MESPTAVTGIPSVLKKLRSIQMNTGNLGRRQFTQEEETGVLAYCIDTVPTLADLDELAPSPVLKRVTKSLIGASERVGQIIHEQDERRPSSAAAAAPELVASRLDNITAITVARFGDEIGKAYWDEDSPFRGSHTWLYSPALLSVFLAESDRLAAAPGRQMASPAFDRDMNHPLDPEIEAALVEQVQIAWDEISQEGADEDGVEPAFPDELPIDPVDPDKVVGEACLSVVFIYGTLGMILNKNPDGECAEKVWVIKGKLDEFAKALLSQKVGVEPS